ncbi:unnamed protein product [Aspergillus oryzae RIB40]|uniref:DNA, SC012 n=1 Tax=Aspergillus oryzae (strain ATCC 42149 / RIB 40) TaxID=510516 RepID=Q2UBX7_ASPOR|nr:unnamed protein product [Aspergillus oryzae RIB40]BAE60938.1 unnamed protein product [Aspergillus oryzae RIB40]
MPSYRLEQASTGRAGCQNKECKDEKVKIAKGELRLGTWVDTERIQAFFWRHWGCVTPRIIASLNENLGDGDEKDYEQLDGFEDLTPENQEKVKKALEQGHVDDDEWKGVCNSLFLMTLPSRLLFSGLNAVFSITGADAYRMLK